MITLAIPNNYICYSYHTFSVLLEFAFLFLQVVIISSIASLLSVFSATNLTCFRAELATSKPVIYMLFTLCSVLAPCGFFWSSEPQGEGRKPLILSEAPLLMLAGQGQEEGDTSPHALDCSTSLAGTTSTSYCNLCAAPRTTEGQNSVSLPGHWRQERSIPVKSLDHFFV